MSSASATPRKLVVAALVVDDAGRVLLAQRPETAKHPLEWELPGGKIEPGEDPETALQRELAEELGLEVEIGWVWDVVHHRYPQFEVLMLVYAARPRAGSSPRCLEAAAIRWLSLADLAEHPILKADQKLVERLVAEGVPTYHFHRGS